MQALHKDLFKNIQNGALPANHDGSKTLNNKQTLESHVRANLPSTNPHSSLQIRTHLSAPHTYLKKNRGELL